VLLLHDLGSSATALNPVLGGAHGHFSLFAPDLPAHGDSDPFAAISPGDVAAVLLRLADKLGLPQFDVIAFGAALAIAQALHEQAPQRLRGVLIAEPMLIPPDPSASEVQRPEPLVPDLQADIAGSHLTRAWYFLRDRQLFFPWHDRSAAAQTPLQRPPRPNELQQSLIDLLKSRAAFAPQLQAAQASLTGAALKQCAWPLFATCGCPARRADLSFNLLPDEKFQWTAILLRALAS
jgi:pimeloyl-ACP methyl ester carboxylesterase